MVSPALFGGLGHEQEILPLAKKNPPGVILVLQISRQIPLNPEQLSLSLLQGLDVFEFDIGQVHSVLAEAGFDHVGSRLV